MLGGKTLPYLVLHGGGSRGKSLCLRKPSPEIALPSQTLAENRPQRRNALTGNRLSQAPFALRTSSTSSYRIFLQFIVRA
ncbi:unnamed protein product [Prunus armeniaca]